MQEILVINSIIKAGQMACPNGIVQSYCLILTAKKEDFQWGRQ
jgi:hypothetical protein